MQYEINSDFKILDDKYAHSERDEVITHLFNINNWTFCSLTRTWRKVVKAEDDEFANDNDEVAFIKEPHHGSREYVEWWYRIYKMAKDYTESKNIFYHEPIISMPERGIVALLIACEVYYKKLENKVFKDQEFRSYINLHDNT